MSQTSAFVACLADKLKLGPAEQAQLRLLAGRGLDHTVEGFDLFTGLWWPLRQKNAASPRREIAWLCTRLHAAFPIRHEPSECGGPTTLASILGREERTLLDTRRKGRFRQRFDSLLLAPVAEMEPHLYWALARVRDAVIAGRSRGLDWVQLTDHLSIWDRGESHRLGGDIREIWAKHYLNDVDEREESHAHRNSHDSEP